MEVKIFQVDSFTSDVFKGNPAGVCITESSLDEEMMLAIAAEMSLSETAFLSLNTMQLRWFTPETEVALCGHGTLATAHVLREQGLYSTGDTIEFGTLSGALTAQLDHDDIHLVFPAPILDMRASINTDLLHGLGLDVADVIAYGQFDNKQLIVINDESLIEQLEPDFRTRTVPAPPQPGGRAAVPGPSGGGSRAARPGRAWRSRRQSSPCGCRHSRSAPWWSRSARRRSTPARRAWCTCRATRRR